MPTLYGHYTGPGPEMQLKQTDAGQAASEKNRLFNLAQRGQTVPNPTTPPAQNWQNQNNNGGSGFNYSPTPIQSGGSPAPQGGSYTPRAGTMPPIQPAQYAPPPSPHLSTSITRREIMPSGPLLASAQGFAGQSMANNMPSGDPAIQQLMRDNMTSSMTPMSIDFDRMAGAANKTHLLGTQTAAAADIGSKMGLAQEQLGQTYRNEAFDRNLLLQLLGAYS